MHQEGKKINHFEIEYMICLSFYIKNDNNKIKITVPCLTAQKQPLNSRPKLHLHKVTVA